MAGFAQHIFISYAHIDNQPMTPGESGWISRFHESLEAMLSSRLGGQAKIWRDEKLQGNDVFSDEILEQFDDTAVLLSVLSPRYLNSEWCTREIASFCEAAERDGGLVVADNKTRFFKVVKTPVESEEELPAIAQDVLGYQFYTYQNEVPLELDAAYGEKYGQDYRLKVAQLAHDLAKLLKKLDVQNGERRGKQQDPATEKLSVYLAECSYDQRETRDVLQGELRLHGYHVLPDRRMPREEQQYKEAVESMLANSAFSVHLVGDTYGAVPDGPTQKSVTEIQNELAVQQCIDKNVSFRRIIWLPRGSRSDQPQQQTFIDALHRDAVTQFGADLITADLETLKASILSSLDTLSQPSEPQVVVAASENKKQLIYLMCDKRDRDSKAILPLRKFCLEKGFEVAIPAFEGSATEIRETHEELLKLCDAVILFYGAGDEAWKRNRDIQLKKMPGYRSNKPVLASFSYLASPRTADKTDLIDLEQPNLIEGFDEFNPSSMQPFLAAIRANGVSL